MTRRDLAHFKVQINKISFANCSEKHSSFYVTFSKLTLLLYRDLLETFTFWGYSDLALHHFAMATLLESSSWVSGHNLVIISNRTQVIKQFIFSHNDFKRKLTKVAHPFYWDQNLKILNMVYSQSIYLIFRTWLLENSRNITFLRNFHAMTPSHFLGIVHLEEALSQSSDLLCDFVISIVILYLCILIRLRLQRRGRWQVTGYCQ